MKNNKTENLKKIVIGVVITLIVGGTSPWWWNKYIDPPKIIKKIDPLQKIYKKGNKTLKIEGVYMQPAAANMSDAFIYKNIDLESGNFAQSLHSDVKITLNVNKLLITIHLKEGAVIGNSETSYLNCKSLIKNNNGKQLSITNKRAPTEYFCTETNSGRISQFKIASIKRYKTPRNHIYSIIIELKYTTWKL